MAGGHLLAQGAVFVAVQVVPHRAVVHDQQRPRVVGVRRVRVGGEPGVEHLVDAGTFGRHAVISGPMVRNVQDRGRLDG